MNPWTTAPPTMGPHLPGAALSLLLSTHSEIPMRDLRKLHGMISHLLDTPHDSSHPRWSLLYVGSLCRSGWAVYLRDPAHVTKLSSGTFEVEFCGRPATITFGSPVYLRTPAPVAGASRVRIRTSTPVTIQKSAEGKAHVSYSKPTTRALHGALDALARRLGLDVPKSSIVLRVVEHDTTVTGTFLGKLHATGVVHGWEGTAVIDCNPVARWLIEVAARIGLGSKTAMGFGRIQVTETTTLTEEPIAPSPLATAPITEQVIRQYRERIKPAAGSLEAIEDLCDIADRATYLEEIPDGQVWEDLTTGIRMVLFYMRSGSTAISAVIGPRADLTAADLEAPRALKSGSSAESIQWTISADAIAAYRDRVERVSAPRAEAAIRWHLRAARRDRGPWWVGPAPSSLRLRARGSTIVDVQTGPAPAGEGASGRFFVTPYAVGRYIQRFRRGVDHKAALDELMTLTESGRLVGDYNGRGLRAMVGEGTKLELWRGPRADGKHSRMRFVVAHGQGDLPQVVTVLPTEHEG